MNWSLSNNIPFSASITLDDEKTTLLALQKLHVLTVEGEDAADFLQNMLTNDVKTLANHQSRLCGLCNPKGRLFAILTVIKLPTAFLLILPDDLLTFVQQRLSMFILRSKVQISANPDYCVFALINHKAPSLGLTECITLSVLPFWEQARIGIISSNQLSSLLAFATEQQWQIGSDLTWQQQLINLGVAQVYFDSKEAFTPQQLNLDQTGGISFKKGCYPGQEVIARLHYLGKPSRRLFKAVLKNEEVPAVNSDVLNQNGEVLGQLVAASKLDEQNITVQLSMKLSALSEQAYINSSPISQLQPYVDEVES